MDLVLLHEKGFLVKFLLKMLYTEMCLKYENKPTGSPTLCSLQSLLDSIVCQNSWDMK